MKFEKPEGANPMDALSRGVPGYSPNLATEDAPSPAAP